MNLKLLFNIAFLIVCFLSYSCKESKESSLLEIPVSQDVDSDFLYSELAEDIQYIKLEDNNEAIISQIDKILFTDEKIYVLQRFFNPRIMVFNSQGEYLYDVGSQGGGPSEFENPYDLLINEGNEVEVLADNSIKRYSTSDGEFINTTKLDLPAVRFEKTNDSYIFICGGEMEEVVITDLYFKIETSFFEKGPQNQIKPMVSLHPLNKKLFYHMNFNDTIFSIQGNDIHPSKVVRFSKPLTKEKLNELYHDSNKDIRTVKKLSSPYMTYIQVYNETQEHIYFTFMYQSKPFVHIYNKKKGSGQTFDPAKIINDVTFESFAPFIFDVSSDGFQVGYIDSPLKSGILENNEFRENSYFQILKEKIKSDSSSIDNPVVFKIKLR